MSHKKTNQHIVSIVTPTVVTGRISGRVPCVGECGRMVLKPLGECRNCRRARRLAGKRRLAKLKK